MKLKRSIISGLLALFCCMLVFEMFTVLPLRFMGISSTSGEHVSGNDSVVYEKNIVVEMPPPKIATSKTVTSPQQSNEFVKDKLISPLNDNGWRMQNKEKRKQLEAERAGGLFPTRIGDVYNNGQYEVLWKLGRGISSDVWACKDTIRGRTVALKITRNENRYRLIANAEMRSIINAQQCVANSTAENGHYGRAHILRLLDQFVLESKVAAANPHVVMVFEISGQNLRKLSEQFFSGFPLPLLKNLIKQMALGLDYLHNDCGFFHGDFKLKNTVLRYDDKCTNCIDRLKRGVDITNPCLMCHVEIVDLGSMYPSRSDDHGRNHLHTTQYRSPELVIGADFTEKADVWAFGCAIWELVCRRPLFIAPDEKNDMNERHLANIMGLLGPLPENLEGRKKLRYFKPDGTTLKHVTYTKRTSMFHALQNDCFMSGENSRSLSSLISLLLILNPQKRWSIHQVLQHPFLT